MSIQGIWSVLKVLNYNFNSVESCSVWQCTAEQYNSADSSRGRVMGIYECSIWEPKAVWTKHTLFPPEKCAENSQLSSNMHSLGLKVHPPLRRWEWWVIVMAAFQNGCLQLFQVDRRLLYVAHDLILDKATTIKMWLLEGSGGLMTLF